MKALVLGSGGREHAICSSLAESHLISKIYACPGNAGTAEIADNIQIDFGNLEKLKKFILDTQLELVIIGPEAPLVNGLCDQLQQDPELSHLKVLGPGKEGALLEGSKAFAKSFMIKHGIPTASSVEITKSDLQKGFQFLESQNPPYVLKADGLAAGKGVIICPSLNEAKKQLNIMLDGKFGAASEKIVIEEFLDGREFSIFILTDGNDYFMLPEAKDYKRAEENDQGLNTGGMGAVSPVPFFNASLREKVVTEIIEPTLGGLKKENINYCGFLFFGIMEVNGSPYVIEYNCRLGDPETQVVLPRIKTDFAKLVLNTINSKIQDTPIEISDHTAAAVIAVSGGYPEKYEKGKKIFGLQNNFSSRVFHAGTKISDGDIVTNGGRVIAFCGEDDLLENALNKSYRDLNQICFQGIRYRKDIGRDLLAQ